MDMYDRIKDLRYLICKYELKCKTIEWCISILESKWNFDVHKVYFLGHDLILIDDSSLLYVVGLVLIV